MRVNKLKYKLILLFGGFTFLLLSIILIYFYTSNIQYIETQSQGRISTYVNLLEEQISKECDITILELNTLKMQIENLPDKNEYMKKHFPQIKEILEKYLLDNPYKYSSISYFDSSVSQSITGQTNRLFNGEIVADIALTGGIPNHYPAKNLTGNISSAKRFMISKKVVDREIEITIPPSEDGAFYLLARIKINYFFRQIEERLNPPTSLKFIVVSNDSVVVYTENMKLMNQKLNTIDSDISKNGNQLIDTEFQFYKWKKYSDLNLYILIIDDYYIEADKLKNLAIKIFVFSFFILLVVLLLVFYFANRISTSIQKITDVAQLVAEGKFDKRLEIKRKDELGILINSFNDMIRKLDSNYKALNDLNVQLENKVRELTDTRNELSHKQRLALVGETISKLSHEIQNKISGLSIWVQNLELQTSDTSPSRFYIEEIKIALKSFQDKLINFKKFYRQPQLNLQELEFVIFLKDIFDKYSLELKAKEITIVHNLENKSYSIIIDAEQFEEALVNILLNAIYYSPEKSTIEISLNDSAEYITLNICDNGPGIRSDDKEKLIQPFYTTKSSGSGLGLAISNNIILAHNGKLNYFNKKEGGACFQIVLPNNLFLTNNIKREYENSPG
ncbi:MAG: sensor histidine kinase [Ignavibacteriales bacterium]|nr:MAG: sensor histidine kinase [Ignavibacteriales bacterium]